MTKSNVLGSIEVIKKNYESLRDKERSLLKERNGLIKQGVEYGTPSYKEGRYLRIIQSTKGGEKQKSKYIGSNKDKISKVVAEVERGKRVLVIDHMLAQINTLTYDLRVNLDRVVWSQKLAIEQVVS